MVLVHDPQLSPTDPYSLYFPKGTNRGHPWWSSRLTSTDSALSPPLPPSNVFPLLQMRRTHWNIWKCDKHEATTEPSLPWLIPFPYPASPPAHPTFTRGNHLIAPLFHLPRQLLHLPDRLNLPPNSPHTHLLNCPPPPPPSCIISSTPPYPPLVPIPTIKRVHSHNYPVLCEKPFVRPNFHVGRSRTPIDVAPSSVLDWIGTPRKSETTCDFWHTRGNATHVTTVLSGRQLWKRTCANWTRDTDICQKVMFSISWPSNGAGDWHAFFNSIKLLWHGQIPWNL